MSNRGFGNDIHSHIPTNGNPVAQWFNSRAYSHSTSPAHGAGPADFFQPSYLLVSKLLENTDARLKVLDLGCGYGFDSILLSGRTNQVWAVDIAEQRVAQARTNIESAHLSDRVFACSMDAQDLGFPDNSFDLILANSVLLWVDKDRVLQECKRVLKPGGRILFSMETLAEHPLLKLHRLRPSKRKREAMICRLDLAAVGRLSSQFSSSQSWYFYLLSPAFYPIAMWKPGRRMIGYGVKTMQKVDSLLMERFPGLRRYAWVAVLEFTK